VITEQVSSLAAQMFLCIYFISGFNIRKLDLLLLLESYMLRNSLVVPQEFSALQRIIIYNLY